MYPLKVSGPSQAEQIAAGMNQGPGINTQLDMRRKDFIKEKLAQMGEQDVNTALAQQVAPQWAQNTQFQRDFAGDTWANRILLQDANFDQRAAAILDGVDKGLFRVEDILTQDLNLAKGKIAQNKADRIDAQARSRVQDMVDYNPDLTQRDVMFDPEFNAIKLQDSRLFERARQINMLANRGEINAADLSTQDLGLMQGFPQARTNRRESAAYNMWNESHPNSQKNPQEFNSARNSSEAKFDQLKNERGVLGAGAFGAVVPGETDRTVVKLQGPASDVWNDGRITPSDAPVEAENLLKLRGSGFTPNVHSLETLGDGSTILEMDNLAKNFTTMADIEGSMSPERRQAIDIQRHQQHGMAALRGYELNDRHEGNVMINNMTGRPMQVDFGMASMNDIQSTAHKAAVLGTQTYEGLMSAGLKDEAEILFDTVEGLVKEGNDSAALDVANRVCSAAKD